MPLTQSNLSGAIFEDGTLVNANLMQANLTGATFTYGIYTGNGTNLTGANLSQANLSNAGFGHGTLSGANLSGAEVRGFDNVPGFTLAQLYTTASYAAHDLTGISLYGFNASNGIFSNKNLTDATLGGTFTNANFSAANLTNAKLYFATLTGTNFGGAIVRGTKFGTPNNGFATITVSQLVSTADRNEPDEWKSRRPELDGRRLHRGHADGRRPDRCDHPRSFVLAGLFLRRHTICPHRHWPERSSTLFHSQLPGPRSQGHRTERKQPARRQPFRAEPVACRFFEYEFG
jgi:uncharacterized protein YjbI with pentapeptide repeats